MSQSDNTQKPNNPQQITITVGPEQENGVYSNFMNIMHSETEFLLDFGMFIPGRQQIKVLSRVLAHPRHAKHFLLALQDNVAKYEAKYGTIPTDQAPRIDDMNPGSDLIN